MIYMGRMLQNILLLVLGVTGGLGILQSQVKQHTLRALDCRNPSKIWTWDLLDMCQSIQATVPAQLFDDVTLIQEQKVQKLKAVRCNRKISRFVMYCGAYSHAKLSLPPDIMQNEVLSVEECAQLAKTNTYFGSKHTVLHVPMNSRRTVKYFEHGSVTFGAYNTECTGSDTTLNGERHTSVVVYVTAEIEMIETTLLLEGEKVVDTMNSVKLPYHCVPDKGCMGGENTYVLLDTPNLCSWREIRTIKGEKVVLPHDGTNTFYWVNKEHKMIIRKAGETTIQGCPGLKTIWESEYSDLYFLINPAIKLEQITADAVNLDLELRISEEYILFRMETQLWDKLKRLGDKLCTINSVGLRHLEKSPFHEDALIRVRGQLIQELKCKVVSVTATEGVNRNQLCYDNLIPVEYNNDPVFLDANSLMIVEQGDLHTVACTDMYTAVVKSEDCIYLQANPSVQPIDVQISSVHNSFMDNQWEHEEEGSDLLYTKEEIRAFQDLVHFRRTRDQVLDGLVRSYCRNEGTCGYVTTSSGNFDVTNLMELAELGWWDWGIGKVQLIGQGASIIVLLYLVGSIIVTVVRAILDSRKYKLPVGSTLWVNIRLNDELRTELYERRLRTSEEAHGEPHRELGLIHGGEVVPASRVVALADPPRS